MSTNTYILLYPENVKPQNENLLQIKTFLREYIKFLKYFYPNLKQLITNYKPNTWNLIKIYNKYVE